MNEHENPVLYSCGLCSHKLNFEDIQTHKCFAIYHTAFIFPDNNKVYPQNEKGDIIFTQGTNDSQNNDLLYEGECNQPAFNKENVPNNNSESITFGTKESFEEILIAAVQERPQIWNYKDFPVSQRGASVRNKLWQEIADVVNPTQANPTHTIDSLKAKWKNLYDTYRSNLLKEKTKSGQAARKHKPWKFMKQMSFLSDILDFGIKRTVSNLQSQESLSNDLSRGSQELSDDSNLDISADVECESQGKRRKTNDNFMNKLVDYVTAPIPQPQFPAPPPIPSQPERDEIDGFCITVEKKLRKFPSHIANTAMFKIYELLYTFEQNITK